MTAVDFRRIAFRLAGQWREGACVPWAADTQNDILEFMDFREKKLYHQIHPLKLATDISVTPVSLYFVWKHRVLPALLVGFVPPILLSLGMLKWTPDLERLKRSRLGRYIKSYMTSVRRSDPPADIGPYGVRCVGP